MILRHREGKNATWKSATVFSKAFWGPLAKRVRLENGSWL